MQNQNEAFLYGVLLTLLAVAAFALWFVTNFYTPSKRLAIRVALPAGAVGAVGVGLGEWRLYEVDPIAGAFLLMPAAALVILAFVFGTWWIYVLAGGRRDAAELKPDQEAVVEPATRESQGGIWCELRELPHILETLDGDLISLATGDLVYWIEYKAEKCIEIKLAGKTIITAIRHQTLKKYLEVQRGVARSLAARASFRN